MHVGVKICGLRDARAIDAAVCAGVDAIGLVLEPGARRAVPHRDVGALLARVPDTVRRVAVFARLDAARVAVAEALGFDALQAFVPARVPGASRLAFLPALADGPDLHTRAGTALRALRGGTAILVDGPHGGGRGVPADAARVAALAWRVPIVLAGGLTPDNVAGRARHVRPIGVDVSSGVEDRNGAKDPARIADFVAAVRSLAGGELS